MIEETATVQSVNDHWVHVITTQTSACHQCNEATSCSTSVLSKFFGDKDIALTLYSDLPLKAGDQVTIGIEENVFMGLTGLVYFVPLCVMLLSAVLGQYLGGMLGFNNELLTIAFALTGFVGSYYLIKATIPRLFTEQKINPVILKKN